MDEHASQSTEDGDELLARARSGEAEAVERLFDECRGYLGTLAGVQVESWLRAKADASDLVQQTLFEAHRDFARFQGRTRAEWLAWLKRILAHNTLDMMRRYHGTAKRQAHREVSVNAGDSVTGCPEPAARGPSPSEALIQGDEHVRLMSALAELSDDHRQVIVLRNLQRLSFDEVAVQLGRTRPAAQMLWMRAVKKLQQALGE
jgi:RNA polymerase sigma-70 factor (ECF subfamily)